MNIKEAKEAIKRTMEIYFEKDEFGANKIPPERQRPVFLVGPPGVGKTDIMAQIATELDVNLVAYSMTHHTRQSAIGLPFIAKKNFGGKEYDVTEYTMSEIIAAVYEKMEKTGKKEGILFLDEINCVSETLSPAMLQFLQYKTFGMHRVPDGWIIVTAGNPTEFNKSARDFDMATNDRIEELRVEADFNVWREYALSHGVHPAIISFLDLKTDYFYKVGNASTVMRTEYVTARGWRDLSDKIKGFEGKGFPVDETLISGYIKHAKIAKEFAIYYDLFMKYRSDYQIDKILAGEFSDEIRDRAAHSKTDEKYAVLGLLTDAVVTKAKECYLNIEVMKKIKKIVVECNNELNVSGDDYIAILGKAAENIETELAKNTAASSANRDEVFISRSVIAKLEEFGENCAAAENGTLAQLSMKLIETGRKENKKLIDEFNTMLHNVYLFCEDVYEGGQEVDILTFSLIHEKYSRAVLFVSGQPDFLKHNNVVLSFRENEKLKAELAEIDLGLLK